MSRLIIALIGPAGSGKTTLAQLLVAQGGWKRTRFADPLKRMIHTLLEYQGVSAKLAHEMTDGKYKEDPSPYLSGQSPRKAMQTLGTEWRDLIDLNLWTDIWKRKVEIEEANVVVDDGRFLHEGRCVQSMDGKVFLISRPGKGPGEHLSEREYLEIPYDGIIANHRTPEDMLNQLFSYCEKERNR